MSYIRTLPNGKFRAEVRENYTSIQSKTFSTLKQAERWADDIEENIETILKLNPRKLKSYRLIGSKRWVACLYFKS